jgi:hypothetical protein
MYIWLNPPQLHIQYVLNKVAEQSVYQETYMTDMRPRLIINWKFVRIRVANIYR